jgi:hypothetical protein
MIKKHARIGLGAAFCVIVTSAILFFAWPKADWPREKMSLIYPLAAREFIRSDGPISIDLSSDFKSNGVNAIGVAHARYSHDSRALFFRTETVYIDIYLITTKQRLGPISISYVLKNKDGEDIGAGQVELDGDLKPKQENLVTIVDARAFQADRIVLSKITGQ